MRPWYYKPLDQTAPKPEPLLGLQLLHSCTTVQPHRVPFSKGNPRFGLMLLCCLLEILNNFILGPVFLNEVLWNNGVSLRAKKIYVATTSACGAVQDSWDSVSKTQSGPGYRLAEATARAAVALAQQRGGAPGGVTAWGLACLSLHPSHWHVHKC